MILSPLSTVSAFGGGEITIPNSNALTGTGEPSKVDGVTGAFTQRIPLDIPPGRNGLQPDISLDYNSQRTQDSVVGYGWSLSIPYIQRLNKTGSQDLYNSNARFASSLEGELAASTTAAAVSASTSPPSVETNSYTTASYQQCTSASSVTFSKSVSATSTLLIVHITSSLVTGVTYAGVAMTLSTTTGQGSIYYLANPTIGTNNIVVSFSSATASAGSSISYAGTATSSPFGAFSLTHNWATGSPSNSITTTIDNSIIDDYYSDGLGGSYSANSPQTQRAADRCAGNLSDGASTLQSTTAGNYSLGWSGPNGSWAETDIEIRGSSATQASASNYVAKLDDGGQFNQYTFTNNTWVMYDKKGNKYTFGSDDSGRMYDTSVSTSTQTYKWMLQEVRDTNGNYVKYTYLRDNNVIYPYKVIYTGNGSTDGISTISFATSTRPDTLISYATAFAATTTQRISEIDASVNGSIVRKYLLGYGAGANGYRSMLTSVQQQGYDDSGNLTSLPATTFSYSTSSAQFYAPANRQISSAGFVLADSNGNGTNDTNVFDSGHGYIWADNSGATSSDVTTIPEYWASGYSGLERGVRYIDVNGDGKADIVRGYRDDVSPSNTAYALYLNAYSATSSTYNYTSTSTVSDAIPFSIKTSAGNITTGGIFGDPNGDGLPDYLEWIASYYGPISYLNNGSGWTSSTNYFLPLSSFPSTQPSNISEQLIDINGDGLDDLVVSDADAAYIKVYVNKGTGFTSASPQWTIATSTQYDTGTTFIDRGIRFMDLNGDGLPDFVRSYQNSGSCIGEVADAKIVYINTGNGWATTTQYALPSYITSCGSGSSSLQFNEYANFNGNGQQKQDILTSIVNSKGGGVNVAYTSSTSTNPELPTALLTVSAIGNKDGLGNFATTTYAFGGGRLYLAQGPINRKFAGFAVSTTTNSESIVRTFYDQGNDIDTTNGEQSDGFGQINHPFRTDVFDPSGILTRRNYYRWDTVDRGNGTFVGLGSQLTEDFGADGTHRDGATAYAYSSTTGDLLKTVDYGEVTGNSDGTYADIGTDL